MRPLYEKALVVGATSGIGEALAARLVAQGTHVIVTGRRQDRLDAFVRTHGSQHATAIRLDVTDLKALPAFAASVIAAHPDLDAVILNAGVQRRFDFSRPETVDLDMLDDEVVTNYLAPVHLTQALLPHLIRLAERKEMTHLVLVGSTLGFMPALVRTPNYTATKGALHNFALTLRQQLRDSPLPGPRRVRVVEAFPPATQTELHDTRHQPDLVGGEALGMPLADCIDQLLAGLARTGPDDVQIGAGYAADYFGPEGSETKRMRDFERMHVRMTEMLRPFVKREE